MPKIIFSDEAKKYHEVGIKLREHGEKTGMINSENMTFSYLDNFYHRSQVKGIVIFRFKHIAKEIFPDLDKWEFNEKSNFENAFIIGLMGNSIVTKGGQSAFDFCKKHKDILSISAIEQKCGITTNSLRKAIDREQKNFGQSNKLIEVFKDFDFPPVFAGNEL